ncbi:hypothetical protein G4Z16_12230 [Streptomyces bathyalis]|uniref:Uncharacterized protein n=1 Tax=Streptomyces bathyalis TaxID=2710756 RepID=A0A7T1WSE0_9ACTN|nr:hypothetical protein [Streptomyces bathyalis]QPP07032.1 hypothetical protein G4Z16_12230 [Streptomyces bathyalis]
MPATSAPVVMHAQRGCPACGESRCADPAECLYFLTSRPWGDCERCEGSGWADELTAMAFGIFCVFCSGSGLTEHSYASALGEISENARVRLEGYTDHLRVRLADSTPELQAVAA